MIKLAKPVALAASLAISACNGGAASAGDESTTHAGDTASALDVIPLTVKSGGREHRFQVEVARSDAEQQQGLMYRTKVASDRGMLFPFPRPKIASFWQKNMLISIDMIYVRADGSIDRIVENTIPGNLEPAVSGGEVSAVLELAGGTAARLGIDESAVVHWQDR